MRAPLLLALVCLLAACAAPPPVSLVAAAQLNRTTESGTEPAVVGWANMTQEQGRLRIVVTVTGLTPGDHGVHVHEIGDCGARPGNATSPNPAPGGKAGDHFNPDSKPHGQHAGDLGNVYAGADGRGTETLTPSLLALEPKSRYGIVGRSLVVHALPDDGTPAARFGARTLCGIIGLL